MFWPFGWGPLRGSNLENVQFASTLVATGEKFSVRTFHDDCVDSIDRPSGSVVREFRSFLLYFSTGSSSFNELRPVGKSWLRTELVRSSKKLVFFNIRRGTFVGHVSYGFRKQVERNSFRPI